MALLVLPALFGCQATSGRQFEAIRRRKLDELAKARADADAGAATTPTPTTGMASPPTSGPGARLRGLTLPRPVAEVKAVCGPPAGWQISERETDEDHTQWVWLSRTGRTAYGVIHFDLPLPIGAKVVHWQFLQEMKKREGEAIDLGSKEDPDLPGLRFAVEGGEYKLRANLIVQGWQGWIIYAGTLRAQPVEEGELKLAEQARENTVPGLSEGGKH